MVNSQKTYNVVLSYDMQQQNPCFVLIVSREVGIGWQLFMSLLFPARQDNLMVWTRDGVWVQLKNYIDPEEAEARVRKDELERKRRANQHLFDREARY